jgi:hypothetical protein
MEMELRRCSVDSPQQVGMTHPLMMSTQRNWERIQLGGLHPNSLQVVWSHARRWSFVETFEETPMKQIWYYYSSSWCLRLWQVVLGKLAKEVRVQVSHQWAKLQVSTIPLSNHPSFETRTSCPKIIHIPINLMWKLLCLRATKAFSS